MDNKIPAKSPSRIILIGTLIIAAGSIGLAATKLAGLSRTTPAVAPEAASPETSIQSLESRVAAKPDDIEGWQLLGWSYFEVGRYGDAATAYRKATALSPDRAIFWSSLGESLVMASERDPMPAEAATAFQTAISKDPNDPRARYFMAVRRDLAGDHAGAVNDWLALLADTPPGAPWEEDLRRTITQVGQINKIDVAKRIAKTERAAQAMGDQNSSVATAAIPGPDSDQMAAAAKLPPGQQETMVRGMVEGLDAKLKTDPSNVNGWIMLMRSRMTLGETAKAKAAYKQAIAANPAQTTRLKSEADLLGVPIE